MNIIEQMLSRYEIESEDELINALKEIYQEIALLGLYRGGFFQKADILLVSNEVGQGIVPMNAMSRRFVDEAGRLHQKLAKMSGQVTWVTAGLPQKLKG